MARHRAGVALEAAVAAGTSRSTAAAAGRALAAAKAPWGAPVTTIPCPKPSAEGAVCGRLTVPLDRARPKGAKLGVGFAWLGHTGKGKARGTIVVPNSGIIGYPATQAIASFMGEFVGDARQSFDVLAVDDRGTGLSSPLSCPSLEGFSGHGAAYTAAAARCAAKLGASVRFYGGADVAGDLELVRRALRLGRVDLVTAFHGEPTLEAFATRYPQGLRSSVVWLPTEPQWHSDPWSTAVARETAATADAFCRARPICASSGTRPSAELRRLAARVATHPIGGGPGGKLTVTADRLAVVLSDDANNGELGALARAANRGDAVPLLRAAAEDALPEDGGGYGPAWTDPRLIRTPDEAPATGLDVAASLVRFCNDHALPWSRSSATTAARAKAYDRALAKLPATAFDVYSKQAWTQMQVVPGMAFRLLACKAFPSAVRKDPLPPHAVYPKLPVLFVGAQHGIYSSARLGRQMAARFPRSTVIGGAVSADCPGVVAAWLPRFDVTKFRCPDGGLISVGTFPRTVADQSPVARPLAGDAGTRTDHAVESIVVATFNDWVNHSVRPNFPTEGAGLRGGTWTTTYKDDEGNQGSTVFSHVKFTEDVTVDGTATFTFSDDGLVWSGTFTVTSPGGPGTVTVSVTDPSATSTAHLTGTIGGRTVHAATPAY
ncbi:MAG TPA: hypothetical protein VE781_01020 [Kineosporiaceae bacterium]|nr:hypothetical protein [Kineosporiaceae bacterium]